MIVQPGLQFSTSNDFQSHCIILDLYQDIRNTMNLIYVQMTFSQ